MSEARRREIPVWDLPTRLFHWSLATLFAIAWVTAEGGGIVFVVHELAGYGMLALVVWRLFWGLVGSPYSRFSSFLKPFRVVRDYVLSLLALSPPRSIGHNPIGGYMIVLLLLASAVTAGSGLFASEDGLAGPLVDTVPRGVAHAISELHEGLASAMLALVILHVAGVAVESLLTRDNLVRAMITGRKEIRPEEARAVAEARPAPAWRAAMALGLSMALTWLLISG